MAYRGHAGAPRDIDELSREEDRAEAVREAEAADDLDRIREDPARHGRGAGMAVLIAILAILGMVVLGALIILVWYPFL